MSNNPNLLTKLNYLDALNSLDHVLLDQALELWLVGDVNVTVSNHGEVRLLQVSGEAGRTKVELVVTQGLEIMETGRRYWLSNTKEGYTYF